MLIELFIVLLLVAVGLTLFSFFNYSVAETDIGRFMRMNIFAPWMATLLFMALAMSAAEGVQYEHCDTPVDNIDSSGGTEFYSYNITDDSNSTPTGDDIQFSYPFTCNTHAVEQVGVSWIMIGFGMILLIFSIVNTVEVLEIGARNIDNETELLQGINRGER